MVDGLVASAPNDIGDVIGKSAPHLLKNFRDLAFPLISWLTCSCSAIFKFCTLADGLKAVTERAMTKVMKNESGGESLSFFQLSTISIGRVMMSINWRAVWNTPTLWANLECVAPG